MTESQRAEVRLDARPHLTDLPFFFYKKVERGALGENKDKAR